LKTCSNIGFRTRESAKVSDGRFTAEAFEDNVDLLLSGELAAGNALDVPDELFRFFGAGLCLPEPDF